MNAYYYTFGSDMRFPYQGGCVQVFAETSEKADAIFRKYFPDRNPGILNCAAIYKQENFPKSMLINGNLGKYCHKALGSEKILSGAMTTGKSWSQPKVQRIP